MRRDTCLERYFSSDHSDPYVANIMNSKKPCLNSISTSIHHTHHQPPRQSHHDPITSTPSPDLDRSSWEIVSNSLSSPIDPFNALPNALQSHQPPSTCSGSSEINKINLPSISNSPSPPNSTLHHLHQSPTIGENEYQQMPVPSGLPMLMDPTPNRNSLLLDPNTAAAASYYLSDSPANAEMFDEPETHKSSPEPLTAPPSAQPQNPAHRPVTHSPPEKEKVKRDRLGSHSHQPGTKSRENTIKSVFGGLVNSMNGESWSNFFKFIFLNSQSRDLICHVLSCSPAFVLFKPY